MLKERLERRIDEMVLRSLQFGKNHGFKPEGKPHFNQLIKDYKEGKEILFSRYIHMLDGFDYESNISGLDNLECVKNEPILIVANHSNEGLLHGHGQRFAINYYVDQITQKEIRWLHGRDKKSPEQFTRSRFAKQSNTILVRDSDPQTSSMLIKQALRNRDIIGLYPEGDGSNTLLPGKSEAGLMMYLSVLKNYAIICVSTHFEKEAFFLTFEPLLDNQILKNAVKLSNDKNLTRQNIADYVMAIIARNLPRDRRGYYQNNYQEIISRFENQQT